MLLPRGDHERRDALVQPEFVPVGAGHEVAPPLMGELVGNDPVLLWILEDRRHHVVADDGERVGLLGRRSRHVHLDVAAVRQGDARLLLEKVHHRARARKQRPQPLRRRRLAEIHELSVGVALRHDVELAGGEAINVARVRPCLARHMRVESSRASSSRRDGAARADSDRRHPLGNDDSQVDRRLVSRAVLHAEHPVAREVARVDGPLAKHESAGRNAVEGDCHRGRLSPGKGLRQRDDDITVLARGASRLSLDRRAVHGQRVAGEANIGEGVALTPERDVRLAGNRAGVEVGRDSQRVVEDIDIRRRGRPGRAQVHGNEQGRGPPRQASHVRFALERLTCQPGAGRPCCFPCTYIRSVRCRAGRRAAASLSMASCRSSDRRS